MVKMIQSGFDYQRLYCLLLSIFTISITDINSKTSTHWILNEIKEQIVPGFIHCSNNQNDNHYQSNENFHNSQSCPKCCNKDDYKNDAPVNDITSIDSDEDIFGHKMMQILNSNRRIYYENGTWELKYETENFSGDKGEDQNLDILLIWEQNNFSSSDSLYERVTHSTDVIKQQSFKITPKPSFSNNNIQTSNSFSTQSLPNIVTRENTMPLNLASTAPSHNLITCYPYANQTQYDHLNGIHYRDTYKFHPEPEVAHIFTNNVKINLQSVEAQLMEAKAKKPNSPNVYTNIGNLLRVHGQSREAVECFRCALRLSPHHPEALLNLARVLYNQNYLEDAIYLTRQSLETQPHNRNPWLQHFTLGEILRSIGHKQKAQYHFLHVLELKPGFRPAKDYLQELTSKTNPITTIYLCFITIFLIFVFLYAMFQNVDFNDSDNENQKAHRHFNRGMAMKALRTFHSKSRSRRNNM